MSKIICDICGTSYPETAQQCPICGTLRPVDTQNVIDEAENGEKSSGYTYVKGGRFSKANVKKRNQEKQGVNLTEPEYSEPEYVQPKEPEEEKTNIGLIITAVVLFVAILALVAFILIRFVGVGNLFSDDSASTENITQTTVPSTVETTNPSEDTGPVEIPCTNLKINGNSNTIRFNALGDIQIISLSLVPANTTDSVEYISDNESVAKVSDNGKVEAVGSGHTKILITCGEQSLECVVVCDFEIPTEETTETTESTEATEETTVPTESESDDQYTVEDLILKTWRDSGEVTLAINESVKIYYGNIPLDKIKLYTEDTSIANVSGDSVVGLKTGTTTLYAEYGDLKVECLIRVSSKQYGGLPGSGNVDNPE